MDRFLEEARLRLVVGRFISPRTRLHCSGAKQKPDEMFTGPVEFRVISGSAVTATTQHRKQEGHSRVHEWECWPVASFAP